MSLEEEGVTSLKFLQTIYRNPEVPLPVRMKAAAIAIEYELPRLAVTATVDGGVFAVQLDRAVARSRMVTPMIEAKPNDTANVSSDTQRPQVQVSNSGKPTILDRRYRSW